MNKRMKKLVLNRETVRALQDTELQAVVGGRAAQADAGAGAPVVLGPKQPITVFACPCASSITNGEGGFPRAHILPLP